MAKLRKMLGDVNSKECIALMRLFETQSERTLASWAIGYARDNYLGIYEAECPGDSRLGEAVGACEEYLKGEKKLAEIKPQIKAVGQIARELADQPTAQAAARAVSVACATVQTPTNALGFLFYGAAAVAYHGAGLEEKAEVYHGIAGNEFMKAMESFKAVCVEEEPNPANLKWNC